MLLISEVNRVTLFKDQVYEDFGFSGTYILQNCFSNKNYLKIKYVYIIKYVAEGKEEVHAISSPFHSSLSVVNLL